MSDIEERNEEATSTAILASAEKSTSGYLDLPLRSLSEVLEIRAASKSND